MKKTKLLIIGSGPAGYTAAIYAARAGMKPLMISGLQPGGQLMITTDVENYPGFEEIIQGPDLMEAMKKQAMKVGTEIINGMVSKVDFQNGSPFTVEADNGEIYQADTRDYRNRRASKMARTRGRTKVSRVRGFCLCNLRRVFLSGA